MTKQEFLAMSLPYGINILWRDGERVLLDTRNIRFIFQNDEFTKPILYPLSDLTKPIEHKGEKFVPIDRFLEDIVREWNMCNINYPNDAKGLYGDIIKNITSCEFWIIQKLIEWHFDIADLLSKGEAINVNTLEENPYK